MSHRKEEHPFHKQCRYYLKGECMFSGDECWNLHEDTSHNERIEANKGEKCFVCDTIFASKFDVMEHKKKHHKKPEPCRKFEKGVCEKNKEDCWNLHIPITTQASTTSPRPSFGANTLPTVQQQDFRQTQSQAPPDQTQLMMALNMLNQKNYTIESLSQRLQAIKKQMFQKST